MDGPESKWLNFDQSLEVAVASWADLREAVSAFDDLTRHGQVVVHLSGPLAGSAKDAAVYLGQLLGRDVAVLESGADELLVARRPILRPGGDEAGDREPRRSRPGNPANQLARDLPTVEDS